MHDRDTEQRIAGSVLGFASSDGDTVNGAEEEVTAEQMRQTVAALRGWRAAVAREPAPPIPTRPVFVLWPLLAAAAAVVAVAVSVSLVQKSGGQQLADELEWAMSVPREDVPPDGMTVRYVDRKAPSRSYQPRSLNHQKERQTFLTEFTFAFNLPETVAGDMQLLWADNLGRDRARLMYGAGERRLTVFLARSEGPDTSFSTIRIKGRTVTVGRREGIAAAFEASGGNGYDWQAVFERFMDRQTGMGGES